MTNASDALEGGTGRIEVRTRRLQQPDARWDHALGATVKPGNWVLVEVEDSGVGTDPATRERIFEPFFSTKKGHGLGLAACVGIVTSHGGALRVQSELGHGSCFSLRGRFKRFSRNRSALPSSCTPSSMPGPSFPATPAELRALFGCAGAPHRRTFTGALCGAGLALRRRGV